MYTYSNVYGNIYTGIAVATTEADEAITSSDFLKIMGISPQKRSQPGGFWSVLITLPRLILMFGYGHDLHAENYTAPTLLCVSSVFYCELSLGTVW